MKPAIVVGAGLAGCEATYQLAKRGIPVRLFEMKPHKKTPAHHADTFAELVCSNSLRSNSLENAVGLLKEEMRTLDSLIMKVADRTSVPAGSALAVDREQFSKQIDETIRSLENVEIIEEEVTEIPKDACIIASGPLTSEALMKQIQSLLKEEYCYFYDAAAPIVTKESIDFTKAYKKSRYDKGSADYINCPMTKEEFDIFYEALIQAPTAELKTFEKEVYFEGCMPIEVMAKRGFKTLTFGPMKPVGLEKEGARPYAVVQLRQDNVEDSLYNLVGFQTHLTFPAQKEVIHLIPGLENAEIVRYGVMHRNSFINSPMCLEESYQSKMRKDLFFAGQMTGVEGYIESAASGLVAGINLARHLQDKEPILFGNTTMIGAMAYYITHADAKHFQPMNANFGIMHLKEAVKKQERKQAYAKQSLPIIEEMVKRHDVE
ncbi:MAG: methylenetetrahydrofolate--tRNA-(uracil(54)-C(5))-methyltransferase (FADH(2)-oxidizing) TrmFO [Solobacterium sp.]|nr:methylenetetrahydrofolate--tRNA-(uracil(54)-C(5))-methyltransferase (FADH(2)-oxidizing) TrmFO [Solobacterium sp.]